MSHEEDLTPDVKGWRKSSFSGTETNCVEVGHNTADNGAAVRDTKDRDGGYITIAPEGWADFMDAVKSDRFTR